MTDTKLVEIEPINQFVAAHTIKVQVKLDEDATDREILGALEDSCKEWASNTTTGVMLKRLVGKILVAVRARGIFKDERWGTFDKFLRKEIEGRHGISRSAAYDAINMIEGVPEITEKRAKAVGSMRLQLIAKAVKHAPARAQGRLRERLLTEAETEKPPVDEFRARLASAKLLRTGRMINKVARIVLEVAPGVAEDWRQLVGERNSAEVFARLVRDGLREQRAAARSGRVGVVA